MPNRGSTIRDYRSALAYLFGRIDYERNRQMPFRCRQLRLDRMRRLLALLDNPQHGLPVVHIAGTKGKGSTAAMIAAVLDAAGYRTGLYTSPHLDRIEERFVVAGRACTERELTDLVASVEPAVAKMDGEGQDAGESTSPTYFEIATAAALLFFRRRDVQCAVLEVGLGGRLDSTNLCEPIVTAITSISLDHTHQLGNTLSAIASEKAGIIKVGIPIITGVRQSEPRRIIERTARNRRAPLLAVGRDFHFRYMANVDSEGSFEQSDQAAWTDNGLDYDEQVDGTAVKMARIRLRLLGRHQAANAAVALATLHQLRRDGWDIPESAMRGGLSEATCPARVETIVGRPTVVMDTAHNVASIRALLDVLHERFPSSQRVLVFAASKDKDVPAMLAQLLPHFEHIILTRYVTNPRAMPPQHLADITKSLQLAAQATPARIHVRIDPSAAWQCAQRVASPNHLICVTGSFFLAAEVRKQITQSTPAAAIECP